MATKDSGALFEFIEGYGGELRSMVCSLLGSLGRRDVARRPGDVDFLVLSAALVVYDRAPRWNPEGAAPWVWAYRALRAEVVHFLGHPRVEFVPEYHGPAMAPSATAASGDASFRSLADDYGEIAEWLSVVEQVANERDAQVHIEYQTQKSLGDPSPANTVGELFGLQPANVRQIDARVRRRLQAQGQR